jgi:hypothetical protein
MKTRHSPRLATAAFAFVALATAGCGEKEKLADSTLPQAKDVAAAAVPAPAPDAKVAAKATADLASDNWMDIKDYTYDQRVHFFAALQRVEAKVDAQISDLKVKRTAMRFSAADTQPWDAAMKDLINAREVLRTAGNDLSKATYETWVYQRNRVGQAWTKTQDAYSKVLASTTTG